MSWFFVTDKVQLDFIVGQAALQDIVEEIPFLVSLRVAVGVCDQKLANTCFAAKAGILLRCTQATIVFSSRTASQECVIGTQQIVCRPLLP